MVWAIKCKQFIIDFCRPTWKFNTLLQKVMLKFNTIYIYKQYNIILLYCRVEKFFQLVLF